MGSWSISRGRIALPILAVLGLIAVWKVHRADASRVALTAPSSPSSAPTIAPTTTASIRAQQAEAIVAANNAEAAKGTKAFTDEGWVLVDAPPPDPLLLSASPTLIGKRERELRWQLSSAPPGEKYLSNVVTIATDAHDAETRVAAVEAIARMGAGDPQFALVSVMKKLAKTDPARLALVPLLRPTSLTDALTITMAALLDDSTVTADERKTLAMTLAIVALHEGSALPADVLESMTPEARALVDDAQRTAQAKAGI